MEYKIGYKVQNKMNAPCPSLVTLDGEIGRRFDLFAYERSSSPFALREILREAEVCFAEQLDDEYGSGMWRSEFWGKLVISAARVARMKNDEELKAALRESAYRLLAYQREDGYLSTYRDSNNIFGSVRSDPTWAVVGWDANFNIWGQKYTLWALLECAMLLDDATILDAAKRLADWIISSLARLGVPVTDTGIMCGLSTGSILKPMLILYRLTGEKRYLDLSLEIAAEWKREDAGCASIIAKSLAGIPVHLWYREDEGWKGKAYELMSCFDGICELYRLTGDAHLLLATERFWEIVYDVESNVLGSVGYCERFANAKAYPDAATEVCDVIHWMRLSYELFLITGKARYTDAFERAYLNAYLAGVYEDGKWGAFFVRSSGRHRDAQPHCGTKYQHCCVNNVARGFVNAAQMTVTESGGDYYINIYAPATVHVGGAIIRIASGYTDLGRVAITVRGLKCGTKIYLRGPEWSKKTEVKLMRADEAVRIAAGEYVPVTIGAQDDVILLEFDMTPKVIPFGGEPLAVPDSDYHVARWADQYGGPCAKASMVKSPMCTVQRGPIILARSKKICSKEEDMFSGKTVFGKNVKCTASAILREPMLAMCYVTFDDGVEPITYTMCDYASAANLTTFDPFYFTIFV
jgi:DUF1680 family protein